MNKLVCIKESSFVKMYGVKLNGVYNIVEDKDTWWTIQVNQIDGYANVSFAKDFNEFESLIENRKRKLKKLWKQF